MAASLPPQIVEYVQQLESGDSEALVAVFDIHGYYLYASPNHKQVLGYTADELLKMHLSQLVDKSEHHAAWVLRTISVFYTKPVHFSTRLVAKSGNVIGIAGTMRHMRQDGYRYFVTYTKPENM